MRQKLCFIIPVLLAGLFSNTQAKTKGIWYLDFRNNFKNFDSKIVEEDIEKLKATGFNSVFLTGLVYQEKSTSTVISLPDAATFTSLGLLIDLLHKNDLAVTLTVFLIVRDGTWRGQIKPSSKEEWFENYAKCVSTYAALAQAHKVEIFAIASEMKTLKTEGEYWEEIITETRKIYKGKIAYNTNWWAAKGGFKRILTLDWFDLVDVIGISAYFELTNTNDPTQEMLNQAWEKDKYGQNILADLKELKEIFDKEIFIWEIGYASVNGTNKQPWAGCKVQKSDNKPDPAEQAMCYEAFLSQVYPLKVISGIGIWAEDYSLPIREKGYDVLGKKAALIIKHSFDKKSESGNPARQNPNAK